MKNGHEGRRLFFKTRLILYLNLNFETVTNLHQSAKRYKIVGLIPGQKIVGSSWDDRAKSSD